VRVPGEQFRGLLTGLKGVVHPVPQGWPGYLDRDVRSDMATRGEAVRGEGDDFGAAADERPPTGDEPHLSGTEERDARADEREANLHTREDRADARDAAQSDREEQIQGILAVAEERDDRADARDSAANTRDATASLHSFLNDEEFATGLKARRSAAQDRMDSKGDRASSAADRGNLTRSADAAEATPSAEQEDQDEPTVAGP
jgi:hypothetical protein